MKIKLRWIGFGAVFVVLAHAAHAEMPRNVGEWEDWIHRSWSQKLVDGESYVAARWIWLRDCNRTPEDNERRVFAELGDFTQIARAGDLSKPVEALSWLLTPIQADRGISERRFAEERAELTRGIEREGLELMTLATAEIPYAITRVGIWRRKGCEFFVLSSAIED